MTLLFRTGIDSITILFAPLALLSASVLIYTVRPLLRGVSLPSIGRLSPIPYRLPSPVGLNTGRSILVFCLFGGVGDLRRCRILDFGVLE